LWGVCFFKDKFFSLKFVFGGGGGGGGHLRLQSSCIQENIVYLTALTLNQTSDFCVPIYHKICLPIWDLKFSHQCCWASWSSVIWCCVNGWAVSDILNIIMSSSSRVTQSKKTGVGQHKVKIDVLQSFEMLQISDPITQHHIQEGIIPSYLWSSESASQCLPVFVSHKNNN